LIKICFLFKDKDSKYGTFDKDDALKSLEEEISRAALYQGIKDSYSREGPRGSSALGRFSQDVYNLHSSSDSKKMESKAIRDQQRDDGKRSRSPNEKSLYRKSRENTPTKRSHGSALGSHQSNDDDLRKFLTEYQKSKWSDDNSPTRDRKRYDSKERELYLSLDYRNSALKADFGDNSWQHQDKERRDSEEYPGDDYVSGQQNEGGLIERLRALSGDNVDSLHKSENASDTNYTGTGDLLEDYRDSLESTSLNSGALQALSLTSLPGRPSDKYRSNFELGRPFFGLTSEKHGREQGLKESKFGDEVKRNEAWDVPANSLLDQRDRELDDFSKVKSGNDRTKVQPRKKKLGSKAQQNDIDIRSSFTAAAQVPRDSLSTSAIYGTRSGTSSSSTTASSASKPLFPLEFLPRQVKVPPGKNEQRVGGNTKSDSPPPLRKGTGYFPRSTDKRSRSRSRSSERGEVFSTLGKNNKLKNESKIPEKGTFTTQNWSGTKEIVAKSKGIKASVSPKISGSTHGRGDSAKKVGRGGFQQTPLGRGRAVVNNRGRGVAKGRARGGRGLAAGTRGRSVILRGRGRGVSKSNLVPVGLTVRNIFRKSRSPSRRDVMYKRSSRSPGTSTGRRSRSTNERKSRSRSRSSSYCSTCSSGSSSTCHSWRSKSHDSQSTKDRHDKSKRHGHHDRKEKRTSKEENDKASENLLEKLKTDIKYMEKQLDAKKASEVYVKKPSGRKTDVKSSEDISKTKADSNTSKDASRDSKTHSNTTKDISKSKLDSTIFKGEAKSNLESKRDVPKGKLDLKATNDPSKRKPNPKSSKDLTKNTSDTKASLVYRKSTSDQKAANDVPKSKLESKETVKDKLVFKTYPKSTSDHKAAQNVLRSKSESKESTKDPPKGKLETKITKNALNDEGGKIIDPKVIWKEKIVKEEKTKSSLEPEKKFKKTESSREVIFQKEKRKESLNVGKREKDSSSREVKIISNELNRDNRVFNEEIGSRIKVDSLKITIDQANRDLDRKKYRKNYTDNEGSTHESSRSSSKSPTRKQKKKDKEKIKSKREKKKSKKRKREKLSGDSEDESVYSSTSEFSSSHEKSYKYIQPSNDERIVEFSPKAQESSKITVHSAQRKRSSHNLAFRSNLITIPLPEKPETQPPIKQSKRQGFPLKEKGEVEVDYKEIPFAETANNVDWEMAGFIEEQEDQVHDTLHQGSEGQEWVPAQEEETEYYYQEGTEEVGYEGEYYYTGEDGWQTSEQGEGEIHEDQYQEWYGDEYAVEGYEGEQAAEYEGQYYLGEDGLYYPVEGESYEEYQGELNEGVVEVMGGAPEEVVGYADEGSGYEYAEEGEEWQQYEEGATYQAEDGWDQPEGQGQWDEYQEGYAEAEAGWGAEYPQDSEFEATGLEYGTEADAFMPQESYGTIEEQGYEQQLAPSDYHAEIYPPDERHHDDHSFQSEMQEESLEPTDDVKVITDSIVKTEETKPLKSILKKSKFGQSQGTKLVSERLAQLKNQGTSKMVMTQYGTSIGSSTKTSEKLEQNQEQGFAFRSQTEAESYREMEEAILSSQPKDTIGTEFIIRLHERGTANFFCQLCQCHFNTLTAKNLHIKAAKHVENYIRLKSSLLKTSVKDVKGQTLKGPGDKDSSTAEKSVF